MANVVQFRDAFFRDANPVQTLEDSVRLTAAYSGVHDFDFQREIDENFNDGGVANWVVQAGATAEVNASRLSLAGGSDPTIWYKATHSVEVPLGFAATFDYIGGDGGFFFKKSDDDYRSFFFWWHSTACGAAFTNADGTGGSNIVNIPVGIGYPAKMQVLVRYSLDSVDEDRKWLEGALFVDGQLYVAFATDVATTDQDWEGDGVGFTVYYNGGLIVDNFVVTDLHRIIEWVTIDPGQAPAMGMSRAIGTTRIRYMTRYDNTLRVWRPGNRDVDWTIEPGRVVRQDDRVNVDVPSHARVQAALHEADSFDDDGGEARMHRFIIHNDPNIMTESEAYVEAGRVLHDNKERRRVIRFGAPPNYLIEPNDRIVIDGESWRVVTVGTNLQMTSSGPQVAFTIEAQSYIAQ